jgi:hypothetical protein
MNPTFNDFAPLYDFSLVEKAVQAFFCSDALDAPFVAPKDDDDPDREKWTAGADGIAFYTAFQALTFTKCRPRVFIGLNNITEYPSAKIIDANGVLRSSAWKAALKFGIITEPNYVLHTALCSTVLAIIPQLQPLPTPDGSGIAQGGVNKFLQYHEVGLFALADASTHITPEDGNYNSPINVNITFSVRASAWPGGIQNA